MGVCQSDTRQKSEAPSALPVPTEKKELQLEDEQSQQKIIKIQSVARGYKAKQEVTQLKEQIGSHQPAPDVAVAYEGPIDTNKIQVKKILETKFNHPSRPEFKDLIRLPPKQFIATGAIYKGQWKDGKRHGRGVQYWPDGSVYQGDWIEDMADGKGRLIHPDGDYYVGDWVRDKAQGKGLFVHIDGNQYEGDWVSDKQHGTGVEQQSDFTYSGQFQNGLKHGKGKINWKTDGSRYEGDFVEGLMEGLGRFTFQNGKTYYGEWQESKMHGEGELVYPDGRKYIGNFEKGEKNGNGKMFYRDGKTYDGQWLNGKQHGQGTVITSDGRQGRGVWEEGRRIQDHSYQEMAY